MIISSMDICFLLKNISKAKKHITMEFMLRDQLLINLKLTIIKSLKRSLNCNIMASIIENFYLNAIGMTSLTKESK